MQLQTGIHTGATKRNPQARALSIGIVVALHIAALYAILNGFMPNVSKPGGTVIDVVPTDTVSKKPTLPPPSAGTFLDPAAAPTDSGPIIDIDRSNTITDPLPGNGTPNGNGVQPVPSTSAQPFGATHTTPPYPALSLRLGEQGTVVLNLAIAADGSVSDARVQTSSGSERLDTAAVAWVKAHWRYKPATRDGTAIASTTLAAVKFDLRQAR